MCLIAFLTNREQRIRIVNMPPDSGFPNADGPQGTLSRPKDFLVHIKELCTPYPLDKYADESTLFEICKQRYISVIQKSVVRVAQCSNDN